MGIVFKKKNYFTTYRDKGPKNICWALGLVQGHFVVQGQINSNEYVRFRTPRASYE